MTKQEKAGGQGKETNPVAPTRIVLTQIDPARVFHALGDPTRRAIVEMLSRAPRTISGLATALSITLTAVGQHLAILEACGLARTEKLGRTRTCSLDRKGLDTLEHWIKERRTPLEESLDRLGELLADERVRKE